MYHERQHRQHCLKHAINNLVQREAFSIASLNKLADSIQAQRTLFLGNYDVNVLAVALESLGLELKWHDARDTQLLNLPLEQPCAQQLEQQQAPQCDAQAQEQAPSQQQQQQQVEGQQEVALEAQQEPQHDQAEQQQQQQQPPVQQQAGHQPVQGQRPHQQLQQEACQLQQGQAVQQQSAQPSGATDSSAAELPCSSNNQHSSRQQQQQQQQQVGIVLNVAGDGWWASLTRGRHWLAIKWLHGSWWNLDSRLPAPCSFITEEADVADGGAGRLRRHLQQQLADGAHVMLVVRQQPGSTAAE
uniref:ubiquitinyl hydrolase 1 n=1 Tax=Tetradesmus obliquus TaxID=3088 RepID=A0A383VBB6_TETOB